MNDLSDRPREPPSIPTADYTRPVSRLAQVGHFVLHFLEMCVAMCIWRAVHPEPAGLLGRRADRLSRPSPTVPYAGYYGDRRQPVVADGGLDALSQHGAPPWRWRVRRSV
jgi:hypothetical protein